MAYAIKISLYRLRSNRYLAIVKQRTRLIKMYVFKEWGVHALILYIKGEIYAKGKGMEFSNLYFVCFCLAGIHVIEF